ncbi:MAG: hypothetical protein Q9171_003365 [Xanthocarpia ochracea]
MSVRAQRSVSDETVNDIDVESGDRDVQKEIKKQAAFGTDSNSGYVAGHWACHILYELPQSQGVKDRPQPFPTWSWANCNIEGQEMIPVLGPGDSYEGMKPSAELISAYMDLVNPDDPFSDVHSGRLRLAARLITTEWRLEQSSDTEVTVQVERGVKFPFPSAYFGDKFSWDWDTHFRSMSIPDFEREFRYDHGDEFSGHKFCMLELLEPDDGGKRYRKELSTGLLVRCRCGHQHDGQVRGYIRAGTYSLQAAENRGPEHPWQSPFLLEFVRQLAQDPQNTVIGLARNPDDALSRYGKTPPTNVTFVEADILNLDSLKSAVSKTESLTGGKLDYLINNAAYISMTSAFRTLGDFQDDPDTLVKDLTTSFATNVVGVIQTINVFVPLLRKGTEKKVLTISTGMADADIINEAEIDVAAPYSISKAAVNVAVAKYNALYKKEGILFMAISPGVVDTGNNPDPSDEESMKGLMALGAKFAAYAPHFTAPLQPDESVRQVLELFKNASLEKGDGGSFISHLGNKQWL